MSDFTHSTLTSPRSPLFSDSVTSERQSGSEIVTSDEEPDLGAFTTVLRAWGYLQPPLRIPPHFQSSSSSRTRSTPTTITGYPGFGGGDSVVTVEESTVWNRIPIQSYFRQSYGTDMSSGRTERGRAAVLQELEYDEELLSSPPPSPASALTVEIASEVDAVSLRSVTYEDGASGERLVVQVPFATPPSIEGRTVSVASGAESHDEQIRSSSPPVPQIPSDPTRAVVNDNTLSSLSSASPTRSSVSNQPLDDNTTISRPRNSPSTLSIVSYQHQMNSARTQTSVFQESPSPYPVTGTTPFSPRSTREVSRPSIGRIISHSSHVESDILNAYYAQAPAVSSPSTDQPVLDFPRPRRLEILAQPPPSGPTHQQPLLEQDSPLPAHRRPSIIDDNSSTSALTEDTPPPSAISSVLQEMTDRSASESPGVHSSHSSSLTPAHTIILEVPTDSTSSTSTTTTAAATAIQTANHTRQSSLDSSMMFSSGQYPSYALTYREQQRSRLDTLVFQGMQSAASRLHYHLLSPEGDPNHEQPSLGYLDEALSFIAEERVRWTAARGAGLHRAPSPQKGGSRRDEEDHVPVAGGRFQEGGTWTYAIGNYLSFL